MTHLLRRTCLSKIIFALVVTACSRAVTTKKLLDLKLQSSFHFPRSQSIDMQVREGTALLSKVV